MKRRTLNRAIILKLILAWVLIITGVISVTAQAATITPTISVSPTTGVPGTVVTVTGTGFQASETGITITFDDKPVASSKSAGSTGSWSGTFTVPVSPSGSHSVNAYGPLTLSGSAPGVFFTVPNRVLSINPRSGPPSTVVTVTGTGFGTNESGITITFDNNPVASAKSANSLGSWSDTFIVPTSLSGAHNISAYGPVTPSDYVPIVIFTVPNRTLVINPRNGPPGTVVTVTGTGFGTNETGISITFDSNAVTSGISSNSQGNWSGTFTVPASVSGPHSVSAYGSSTLAGSLPGITFVVNPTIAVNPTSGPPGSSATVTGSGFSAGETGVMITFDSNSISSGISADSLGNWSGTFTVPASSLGSHNIGAKGSITQASSLGGTNFKVSAGISLNPASGYVGGTVQISGFGFAPNSPLTFTYEDKEIPVEGATTDATGSFVKSFVVPKSKAGDHTVGVTDGQKNSAKATFSMNNTPPPAPVPLSPGDAARISILGNITPTFSWSNVADPSGVTYSLQVDTYSDFSQILLDKTDIPTSHYTLTATEALPRGHYYWRVKAINGASNESSWSQVRLLKAGLMPLWALLLIILAGIAVVGGGAYFGWRRLKARRREREVVTVPEITVPQIVTGQWREIGTGEEALKDHQLSWRLALPEPAKGAKTLSTEDRARLLVIIDFAQSLPLVEPGYDVNWVVDLIETTMGTKVSAQICEQLLKGELQASYEPQWMRHPTYQDLLSLLDGQPILQDMNGFVDAVNQCALQAVSLLQDIYHDTVAEVPPDFMDKDGWAFISSAYSDAVNWFRGKSLHEPSERDYTIKPQGGRESEIKALWLSSEDITSFAGPIMQASSEEETLRLRSLHLNLRRAYRENSKTRVVVSMLTQLEVQRSHLLSFFSQFGRLKE